MERLELDATVFEGPSNAYLLHSENGGPVTIIDTGVATSEVADQLRTELKTRGLSFADVDNLLITHFHYDHAGLAGTIQAESNATVWCHEQDAALIETGEDGIVEQFIDDVERLRNWGIPARKIEALQEFLRATAPLAGQSVDTTPIKDQDLIDLGQESVSVIHLPGHTAGHVGYQFEDGVIATGDVVLPGYTANVGGADIRLQHPLDHYFDSLENLNSLSPRCLKPGHGDPISEPVARIQAIIDHHTDRAQRIIKILQKEGPTSPWDVAISLFGDLDTIHILQGTGEAFAHLDYLLLHDHLSIEDGCYRIVDPVISTAFPSTEAC